MSPSTRNIGKVGGGERRSRLLLVSLIGSLVLVALLSWQAVDAARSHRATATAVLGDYARLALDEYVRRTANEIGYYGYYPLLTAVRQLAEEQPGRLPTRSEVEGRLDAGRRRALELAGPLFRIGLEPDGTVQYDGESAARDWLVGRLRELGPDGIGGEGIPTLHGVVDGSPRSFVFDRISSDEGEVVGFEVRLDRLGPWFRQERSSAARCCRPRSREARRTTPGSSWPSSTRQARSCFARRPTVRTSRWSTATLATPTRESCRGPSCAPRWPRAPPTGS